MSVVFHSPERRSIGRQHHRNWRWGKTSLRWSDEENRISGEKYSRLVGGVGCPGGRIILVGGEFLIQFGHFWASLGSAELTSATAGVDL